MTNESLSEMRPLSEAPTDGTRFLTFAWDCDGLIIACYDEGKCKQHWDMTEIHCPEGYWPLPTLPPGLAEFERKTNGYSDIDSTCADRLRTYAHDPAYATIRSELLHAAVELDGRHKLLASLFPAGDIEAARKYVAGLRTGECTRP